MMTPPLLEVQDLHIAFGQRQVVQGASFTLQAGQCLGVVGESGSGKSMTAFALAGLLPPQAQMSGDILLEAKSILHNTEPQWQALRGRRIAFVFQEPQTALNPVLSCGLQVTEVLCRRLGYSPAQAKARTLALFAEVKLQEPARMYTSYPHQLSGGQQQRVMIAAAIACQPALLIADEPTTALDASVQQEILLLLDELRRSHNMALLLISHDLALVAAQAQEVLVLYQGRVVEQGPCSTVLQHPQAAYTQGLLACRPAAAQPGTRLPTLASYLNVDQNTVRHQPIVERQVPMAAAEPDVLVQATHISKSYVRQQGWRRVHTQVLSGVSLSILRGECLALVGESGSGKSTLGRVLMQLVTDYSGQVHYGGKGLHTLTKQELLPYRQRMQLIFQDPYAALNPRLTIADALCEPLLRWGIAENKKTALAKAAHLLEQVQLPADSLWRYPHQFSGGQRQRIVIARALAVQPEFVVCDECVSALDVSVQAEVLNLLQDLQTRLGLTYLFITHDLGLVRYLCPRVVVLQQGRVVEAGQTAAVFTNPQSEYTAQLLAAVPKLAG